MYYYEFPEFGVHVCNDFLIEAIICPPQVTGKAAKNRGKKRKKPSAAASAAAAVAAAAAAGDDDGEGGESASASASSSAAATMHAAADAVRVPGLSHDLQQQITKFDSSEFDVSSDTTKGSSNSHLVFGQQK